MHPNIHSSIICSTKDQKQTIPSMDTWVKKINIYTMIYFSAVKLVAEIWSSMDEPGEYHTSLMWNLKKKETNKYSKTERDSQVWRTDGYLPEGMEEKQDGDRWLRGANYHMQNG